MRIFRPHPVRLARALIAVSIIAVAAGCGGGSSNSIPNPGSNSICDPNNSGIQLARPAAGQFGVATNTNTIEIVANGNADQLGQFTNQFDLNLIDNFNNEIDTGTLTAVADPNGPHPYQSDFFYSGTLNGSLLPSRTYSVYLNAPNTNCSRGLVGQFST
ncbi:MAG TPA: hypothetical protein VGU66_10155 [Candidatus Elarobacter sp.]|nr:hypothetical protein [Candidatus Elarobacter sp.]